MNKIRRTKIVATIGPASQDSKTMRALLKAGAQIFRFNLKHASPEDHMQVVKHAQGVIKKADKKAEILLDFPSYKYVEGFELAQELAPEYIALSYIKNAQEIELAKDNLKLAKIKSTLISKIETEEALKAFSSILDSTKAIMIARGDLGRSIKLEYVPFAQKEIIQSCNKQKKFVIVATEMLMSMTKNKQPTRAEAGDVANAVIEGADAVMLSEETAVGKNPVLAVETMDKILELQSTGRRRGISAFPQSVVVDLILEGINDKKLG